MKERSRVLFPPSAEVDVALDIFGARQDPKLFVLVGVVTAFATAPIYGWLLQSRLGNAMLSRIGL
jgi:hypothetical protein